MGDEQRRAALGELEEVGRQGVGRGRVEVLGRLVEDENGELGQQGAGQRDALALTARETGPARPDPGGQTRGQPCHQSRRPTRASTAMSSSSLAARRPIRRFSARLVSKRCGFCSTSPTTRRTSSEGNRSSGTPSSVAVAGVDGQEADEDVGQRRLARSAAPDQRHPASRSEVEVHPAQDRRSVPG